MRRKSLPMTRLRTVSWPTIVMTLTARGRLLALGEVFRDRPRRIAVRPEDDRRDALGDLRLEKRIRLDALGRVVVHVDEPGRENEPLAADHQLARARRKRPDLGDLVSPPHANVGGRFSGAPVPSATWAPAMSMVPESGGGAAARRTAEKGSRGR